jgi:hypothetical protein
MSSVFIPWTAPSASLNMSQVDCNLWTWLTPILTAVHQFGSAHQQCLGSRPTPYAPWPASYLDDTLLAPIIGLLTSEFLIGLLTSEFLNTLSLAHLRISKYTISVWTKNFTNWDFFSTIWTNIVSLGR